MKKPTCTYCKRLTPTTICIHCQNIVERVTREVLRDKHKELRRIFAEVLR
jgi:hypothetical protein